MLDLDDTTRSATRAGAAYEAIKQDILSCKLLPGQRLRSDGMKLQYGVGVSTIREALSRLVADGLVQQVDQRGARVADVSESDLRDLLHVREEIECLALCWSVERGDEAWEANVVSRFHMFRKALDRAVGNISDDDEIQGRHEAFHLGLVAACGSPRLTHIIHTLYAQTRRYRLMADYGRSSDSDVAAEHEEIMKAALDRDSGAAAGLFRRHAAKTADLALLNLGRLKERMAAAGMAT